ncbi:MAG: DNA replication/repair protein RecF [Candidatus Cloacimonetes bacterium]|nr:DNA replication/repair protein RecF [Candidatus Cloacimonadota bacterium]
MVLHSLSLTKFRNYDRRMLEFPAPGLFITGANGCGKTNLLEAVAYLSSGKSIRLKPDSELVRFGQEFFRLSGEVEYSGSRHTIEVACDTNHIKTISIDSVQIDRLSELYRGFKTVYSAPGDVEIVTGSPGERRRFFDLAIAQHDVTYLDYLRRYRQVLKQRNQLLKERFNRAEKEAWDNSFVEATLPVIEKRLSYLDEFRPVLREYYRDISGEKEELQVEYKFEIPTSSGEKFQESYLKAITTSEDREREQCRTLFGPHLADWDFLLDGKRVRSFASQGQNRSIAIALRLVQAEMVKRSTGESPVLMLDDVLAELDASRRSNILNMLHGQHQVLIAAPDIGDYRDFNLPVLNLTDKPERGSVL